MEKGLPDGPSSQDPFGLQVVPIGLSTYLSKAGYDGNLFDQSTYSFANFDAYMDSFAEATLVTLKLPESMNPQAILTRFEDKLHAGTGELKKLLESTEADDLESVKNVIKKVRARGGNGFDELIEYMRDNDFPPILWLELGRANKTFIDSLGFVAERLQRSLGVAPKYKSQSRQRSDLAQRMSRVALGNVFGEFTNAFTQMYRLLLFIEIWSCSDESELFTGKPWTFRNVDKSAFDEVFMSLHASISSLRQALFEKSEKREIATSDDSVSWAIRELVRLS